MKACLSFLNEIVQIHQYSPSTGHSSMALPVEQIMSQLQRGDCEDIEEEDDDVLDDLDALDDLEMKSELIFDFTLFEK